MQFYTEVYVDVSVSDIMYGMGQREKQELLDALVDEDFTCSQNYNDHIEGTLPMDDPAIRLDAINYLRKNGWTVESA
jgi:hypothetical protein